MIDDKQIKALTVLGWNFGIHWLKWAKNLAIGAKVDQAELFKGYFSKDWITSFRKEEVEQVYNFQKCTVCGLCQEVCTPSWVSEGKFLGPEHIAACAGRSQPEYISDIDDFLRCTLCGRCENVCPEQVKISELSWLMRKWIFRVDPGTVWGQFPEVKKNIEQSGNPFGQEKSVKAADAGTGGRILFLGCREMALGEPDKWVELAKKFKLEAKLVSGVCCGGLLSEIGVEDYNQGLEKIIAQNPAEIVTVCPHCHYHLKKKLPDQIKVKFIMELIPENMAPAQKPDGKAVYHDPCFLSRKMGIAELPRQLIKKAGIDLLEFSNSPGLPDCCGGGGGLPWYDPGQAGRIAERRVAEAQKLGAQMILTECGICKDLFEKASKGKLKIKRVSELYI